MRQLAVDNPFNAPIYHEDTVDSTMDVSRILAWQGEPHGTVIAADFQKTGRGRMRGRSWDMEKGTNLAFTLLLRFSGIEKIPPALTLRTGLAVSRAIEDFAPILAGRIVIKWPNDILIVNAEAVQKAVGILTEADGGNVHIGIGVNVAQKQFPDFLRDKATSISLAMGTATTEERFTLLHKILVRLHSEIETANDTDWKSRIESQLYKKGEQVSFIEGAADSGKIVSGILAGIGPGGELLIAPSGEPAAELRSFTAGELVF
ncbi:MAG: biotin--[acetyl-CoA-carboxylase] ligase [Treponema sp.]|jgi:BirA family biotin operon repressor/biotin-[acetyl-CoA-carboxylase] ligase|nr:biotin--[acetyl-CoA-carboxylase] ligase [Treponema sp.]